MPRSSKKGTKKTAKKSTKKTTAPKARSVAKKATKRATKKVTKSTTKKADQRILVCANNEECFWTSDGQILQNLEELAAALDAMSKELFTYHATRDRNDFADWVEHVLDDAACAADLRKARTQSGAHKVVIRHLRYYA
jgi:hypothetical protein